MLAADAVDLLDLARTETLAPIEAPDSREQPLPPQDFVAAGNAAVKVVGNIEKRAVAVGDARIERQKIGRHRSLVARGAAHLELLDGASGPHRPVAEQSAFEIGSRGDAALAQIERQREVEQDVIVIAGIERNAIERARSGYAAQHVQRAIAIKRSNLDGDDVVDLRKAAAELRAQYHAADRRLKIKSAARNFARHRLAMRDNLVF